LAHEEKPSKSKKKYLEEEGDRMLIYIFWEMSQRDYFM
jgi:hypothetical protein